jgi:hypothetical protein
MMSWTSLKYGAAKAFLVEAENHGNIVTTWANTFTHFYTLWCVVTLSELGLNAAEFAGRYGAFMTRVAEVNAMAPGTQIPDEPQYVWAATYLENSQGASTEPAQRVARFDALRDALAQA